MNCGIYQIRNIIDDKKYIGQSINIKRRWKDHRKSVSCASPGYNNPLYRAIRKHGIDNFAFEILEFCEKDLLDEKEQEYIQKYNTIVPQGYNITEGGTNARTTFVLSNEEVDTIIELLMVSDLSQQEIAKQFQVSQVTISNINIGDYHTREGLSYPIRGRSWKKKQHFCLECNVEIYRKSTRCVECEKIRRKKISMINRPPKDTLKILIYEFTFVELAKKFDVSRTTIRRWCEDYGLPFREKEIRPEQPKITAPIRPSRKPVRQIDLKTKTVIAEFDSIAEAERLLNNGNRSKIGEVANGQRKTALGYGWEFINL